MGTMGSMTPWSWLEIGLGAWLLVSVVVGGLVGRAIHIGQSLDAQRGRSPVDIVRIAS